MASKGVNKVIILGNLGQDPEIRRTQSGDPIATLNIATSETWRDKATGEEKSKTEWHRVVIFGKLAEIAEKYLKKGAQVYVEGQLQTRKWSDQQGVERYTTEVIVQGFNGTLHMVGGRSEQLPTQQANQQQYSGGGQPSDVAPDLCKLPF